MRRIAVLCMIWFASTGCEVPPEASWQATCATICSCVESLPAQREQCETECMAATPASEACELCVLDRADRCESIAQDCNTCFGTP